MYIVSADFTIDDNLNKIFAMEDYITATYKCDKDSGAGFGFRDVSFYIQDENDAWDVLLYMRKYNPVSDSIYKEDE